MDKEADPKRPRHFSDETLQSLRELGELFARIHACMTSEGYVIKDGRIMRKVPDENNHGGNNDTRKSGPQ